MSADGRFSERTPTPDRDAAAKVAGLEASLAAANIRLLDSAALETQLRRELEDARLELARTQAELAHQQQRAKERERVEVARCAALEQPLDTQRDRRIAAEKERRAVIAALGRGARRRLRRETRPHETDAS
jgi:hypothetical protein